MDIKVILKELLNDVLEIKQTFENYLKEDKAKKEKLKKELEELYNSEEWLAVKKTIEEIKNKDEKTSK